MNFVLALVIGAVIGAGGGYLLRQKQANAIWLGPVLGVVGAVLASVLAAMFGDPGYGWQEAGAQIVFALAGVGVLYGLTMRGSAASSSPAGSEPTS
ncbi:MAG TPA: hypothetical protein VFC00_20935 [Micromonosporaceae bacterium]|nr:hypothetical protein [Micromonosporaceae bacterium]